MSLKLYLPLNELTNGQAQDESGQMHTVLGGAEIVADAKFGSVMKFDGSNGRIELPPSAFPVGNEMTVSFWAKGGDTLPKYSSVLRVTDAGAQRVANIHLPWINQIVYFDAGNDGSAAYDRVEKQAQASEYKDQWRHWAFSKNAATGEMKIYLDSKLWHEATGKTKVFPAAAQFTLGSMRGGTEAYEGQLAHVRIYNEALSQTKIQEDMAKDTVSSNSVFFSATSKVEGSEGNAYIVKSGKKILSIGEDPGIYIATFNQYTGALLQKRRFSVQDGNTEIQALADYVQAIPSGNLVILTSNRVPQARLTILFNHTAAQEALQSIGSSEVKKSTAPAAWAVMGYKGEETPLKEIVDGVSSTEVHKNIPLKTFSIEVESKGYQDDGSSRAIIRKDGQDIVNVSSTATWWGGVNVGIYVAVFNEYDGSAIENKYFPNQEYLPAFDDGVRFDQYIKNIPDGRLVAVAVCGDGSENVIINRSEEAIAAFKSIGSEQIESLSGAGGMALIGYKGVNKAVYENLIVPGPATAQGTFSCKLSLPASQQISNRSLLVDDYVKNSQGQIETKTSYRTIISLSPEVENIRLWSDSGAIVRVPKSNVQNASDQTPAENEYTLSTNAQQAITLVPNTLGKIIVHMDDISLWMGKLFVRTSEMTEAQTYSICPDVEVHKKLSKLDKEDFYSRRVDFFQDNAFVGMNGTQIREKCDAVHETISNLMQSIQYTYGRVGNSLHHDRHIVPSSMNRSNFQMNFSGEQLTLDTAETALVNQSYNSATAESIPSTTQLWNVSKDLFDKAIEEVKQSEGKIIVATAEKVEEDAGQIGETITYVEETAAEKYNEEIVEPLGELLIQGESVIKSKEELADDISQGVTSKFNETVDDIQEVMVVMFETDTGTTKIALQTVEEVGVFMESVIESVGADINKVIDDVKSTFDWKDIVIAQKGIISTFNQGLDYVEGKVSNQNTDGTYASEMSTMVTNQINQMKDGWSTSIDNVKAKVQSDGVSRPAPESAEQQSSKNEAQGQLEWLLSKFAEENEEGFPISDPSQINNDVDAVFQKTINGLTNESLDTEMKKVLEDVKALFTNEPSIESIIVGVLDVIKSLGTVTFTLVNSLLNLLFELLASLLQGVRGMLNAEITLPFISDFYTYITDYDGIPDAQKKLTLLNLFSLMVAAPLTIMHKAITGEQPAFPSYPTQSVNGNGVVYGVCQILDGVWGAIASQNVVGNRNVDLYTGLGSVIVNFVAQGVSYPTKRDNIKDKATRDSMLAWEQRIWVLQFVDPMITIGIVASYVNAGIFIRGRSGGLALVDKEIDQIDTFLTTIYEIIHGIGFITVCVKYGEHLSWKEKAMYFIDPVMGVTQWVEHFTPNPMSPKVIAFHMGRTFGSQGIYGALSIINAHQ